MCKGGPKNTNISRIDHKTQIECLYFYNVFNVQHSFKIKCFLIRKGLIHIYLKLRI